MLYVFHVDTGTTITFDIKHALRSVSELKEAIERECGVSTNNQVLLMSGGESLETNARVCSYSAGTDTNPIYLFSRANIESQVPPVPNIDYGSDVDLQSQVDSSLALPATYQTLVARAQLAHQFCVLARDQTRICERLVHDQHLQQQGWAAVLANLEDVIQTLQVRSDNFQLSIINYLPDRAQYQELLSHFHEDLQTLDKIPILPALRAIALGYLTPADQQQQQEQSQSQSQQVKAEDAGTVATINDPNKALSLLNWISSADKRALEMLEEQCQRSIEQFDERFLENFKSEINSIIESAKKHDMIEIKGLGERLFALEQLMAQTKKHVHEQSELAQGFHQNKARVSHLNDDSVLPDLCMSHRRQLVVMLQNHNHLRDIRRRCTKAKEELSISIHRRLKWIMYVENRITEMHSKLTMYCGSMTRLRRQIGVIRQIHEAPQMYVNAIAEVVRRRTFSQAFLSWASNLACQLLTVHNEEIERRREFQNKFEGHFLSNLFPGLEDTPPPFATQAPTVFDNSLPKLTPEDMELLKQQLPEGALTVSSPDMSSVTQFFLSKSSSDSGSDGNKEKESTSMPVDPPLKDQEGVRPPIISDRTGFESETDTEEFEKISHGTMDSKMESVKQDYLTRQKQLEVGASISTSSTSTNISPLNRSSPSSSEFLHFLSMSVSEKQQQQQPLSPLTECVEYSTMTPSPKSSSNFPIITSSSSCDGQQKKQRRQSGSDGSSPSVGIPANANDFLGTEFYMDESLPSSLSEHPTDSQHQAIVSLLQESLGNTRQQIDRLSGVLSTVKVLSSTSLQGLRNELLDLKEQAQLDRANACKLLEELQTAMQMYMNAQSWREQEMTVDHELELSDMKKMLQEKDEQVQSAKNTLLEKQTETDEQQRLLMTMKQKFEEKQEEIEKAHSVYRQMEEKFKESQQDKENTIKFIKEESEKLQMEYKTNLEAIKSRYKLMSTMERAPSDSSLEKIERVDVIELVNHETILAQVKKDLDNEKEEAIRLAIERERISLTQELQMVKEIISKNEHDLEVFRQRENALLEECNHYKSSLQRLNEAESVIRNLEADKAALECKIAADREKLEQRESLVLLLEVERDGLRRELNDERLKMSQTNIELGESMKNMAESEKDEVRVSESKKVRLEMDGDLSFSGRFDASEADNKRLTAELRALKESNKRMESKLEALENERVKLEVELVKERSKRNLSTESLNSSSIASGSDNSREKDMNISVSVVSEALANRADASTSTDRTRRGTSTSTQSIREKLTKSTTNLMQLGKINFTSCNPGDIVLVLWDQAHRNYTLLQDSQTFYFLNSDCIADLDLELRVDGLPTKLHAVAEVVEKEYCSARKAENRYKVPQGTKFYRVRVKPLQRHASNSKNQ